MTAGGAAGAAGRRTVDDWVDAALDIIADEGPRAVKISRLCARLGVTKGSFYWHFADLDTFLAAVAARWGDGLDSARREFTLLGTLEPAERLTRMAGQLTDRRRWRTERAVREWARTDDRVRAAVAAADGHLMEMLRRAFGDLGFGATEAEVRARALYYAGIGFIHVGGRDLPDGGGRYLDDLLRLMTAR